MTSFHIVGHARCFMLLRNTLLTFINHLQKSSVVSINYISLCIDKCTHIATRKGGKLERVRVGEKHENRYGKVKVQY